MRTFLFGGQSKIKTSSFFYGAFKGNPRLAGEGGIIFYPRGKTVASSTWGFGKKTNNKVEWLALYFRVNLAKQLNIMDIIILDNSKHVIHQMIKGSCKSVIKQKDYMIASIRSQLKSKYLISIFSEGITLRQT